MADAKAKTVNLLLYEGDLEGVISIEDSSWICTDKSKPILTIRFVPDTYDFCRNWIFFPNHDIDRKKIFGSAATLLVFCINLFDVQFLSFILILNIYSPGTAHLIGVGSLRNRVSSAR